MGSSSSRDLTRTTLGVLCIGTLTLSTAWIMRPFLSALVWAAMIVISTWTLMLALQARMGGRRGLATAVMTVVLLLVLVIPLVLGVGALIGNIDNIIAKAHSLKAFQMPAPPSWVANIPIEGPRLS